MTDPAILPRLCARAGGHLAVQLRLDGRSDVCCLRCGQSVPEETWVPAMRFVARHWTCKGPERVRAVEPDQGTLEL